MWKDKNDDEQKVLGHAGFFVLFEQAQQLFLTCAQQGCVVCKPQIGLSSASDCWCSSSTHSMVCSEYMLYNPGDITQPCLTSRSISNQSVSPLVVRTTDYCSLYRFATSWIMWTGNPICSIVSHSFIWLKCLRIINETHIQRYILVSTLLNNNPDIDYLFSSSFFFHKTSMFFCHLSVIV